MRRLAFVCNNSMGLSLFRRGVIEAFVHAGYEVHVVAPYDSHTPALIAAGVRFTELRLSRQGTSPFGEARLVRSLVDAYNRIRPDLVFHYTIKINIYGTYAAKRLRIPCVCVVPGLGIFPDVRNGMLRRLLASGYAFAARNATEFWFLNQHDHGFFESRGWLAGVTTRVIPGEGVDTLAYQHTPLPERRVPRVLFIGRLLRTKGVEVFAQAAALAAVRGMSVQFELLGHLEEHNPSGVSADEMMSWIDSGTVRYHGAVRDVRPYLYAAELVILPTYFREGLNRVIQEAMATGRPVITTNVPGAGELVIHGSTGYIVPTHDAHAVVDALAYHLRLSAAERAAMGRRARRRVVERYDESLVRGHYYDAVSRISRARESNYPF